MVISELEQQLLQLSPNDKFYIIQLLAQSLTMENKNNKIRKDSGLNLRDSIWGLHIRINRSFNGLIAKRSVGIKKLNHGTSLTTTSLNNRQ
ncbi:hypothetical protein AA650_16120 [Anabaena sp. WA102]|jgi:hypothetical protein|nr:hypothetical protein AA650_16120 [Anabaena sp. WA102]